MWKKIVVLMISVLVVCHLTVFGFPGKSPGAGPTATQTISWVKYDKALEKKDEKKVWLLFFGGRDKRDRLTGETKFTYDSEANQILYVSVILDKSDLKTIKKLRKSDRAAASDEEEVTKEIEIGLKYKISGLPTLIGCDYHGNALQKFKANDLESSNKLETTGKGLKAKQQKLYEDLFKRYEKAKKLFEKESEKKKFTLMLIKKMLKITEYTGYKPCVSARANLDEINKYGEEEFNSIVEKK
ncbi:MAG: hypothetical protein KAI63_00530, partial [Planctomycetes bacterium]|nr:hypothetical protein [Planctomycetota bacterium]